MNTLLLTIYTSASEVVREALRLMEEKDRFRAIKLEINGDTSHISLEPRRGQPLTQDIIMISVSYEYQLSHVKG